LAIRGDNEMLYPKEILQNNYDMGDRTINAILTMEKAPGRKK
jgi:hypothetical protein